MGSSRGSSRAAEALEESSCGLPLDHPMHRPDLKAHSNLTPEHMRIDNAKEPGARQTLLCEPVG